MSPDLDAAKLKSATRALWDRHAKGWNDHGRQIHDWLQEPTDAMLAMAGIGPGMRVLDVAAGAGDQSLEIARRVGPDGSVLATDLSRQRRERRATKMSRPGRPMAKTCRSASRVSTLPSVG